MHFYRVQRNRAQVPIVPLIDILFILLVFFVVSTTFKKPRDILKIELPTIKDIPTEKAADNRSVIAVDAEGNVSLDSLQIPSGLLSTYLTVFQKQNPGRKLELKADKLVPLEKLLMIWEALGEAGIAIKDVPARIKLNN